MKLAYVTVPGRGTVDDLVVEIVRTFASDGVRLAGTVRAEPADPLGHPCDIELRVLPAGPGFRISQPLGSGAKGCRLDGGVIEAMAAAVEARLSGAELLIVNKFGKQEAQGRGLCGAIASAVELAIPVLVGVSPLNLPEFLAFSAGTAVSLPPRLGAVRAWYDHVRSQQALVAV